MGGGSDKAAKQAARNEKERQRKIDASTSAINRIFADSGRTAQYDQLAQDTTAFLLDDLNRQKADTDRGVKFAMARSGLTGGSVAADTNQDVSESYLRGTVEATRRGNAAGADLRAADAQAKSNLLAMAQSGLDMNTAASQSASMLRNNLLSGQAASTAQGIGDIFGSFAETYRKSKDQAAERRGVRDTYNMLYQPGFGYGGGP